ncbi:MAG TPA: FlgD immunoglobulin-like domain containing protein [Candidatus Eisenbacteria bacterium]|jgi:hypothetical protein
MHRRPSPALSAAIVSLLLIAALPRVTRAAWPHDPFANIQLGPSAADQLVGSVISDGAGGAIVAWADSRSGGLDIYAQHITAQGTVAAGWPGSGLAVCKATGDQSDPVMISDGAGGAIIAWADGRVGAGNRDIFVERVDGSGAVPAGWPENGRQLSAVNLTKDEQNPVIVSDGAGGAIVVWELIFAIGTDIDICGGRVDGSGNVLWSGPEYEPGSIQEAPAVVPDGAAGAMVAFEDNQSGNFDIRELRFGPSGFHIWGANIVCNDPNPQTAPVAAGDGAGGAIIAWQDLRNGDNDIFASRMTSTGARSPGWTSNGNPVAVFASGQSGPLAISDGSQGAFIAWADSRTGNAKVFAQHLLPSGAADSVWPANGLGLCSAVGNEFLGAIAPDGSGGAIVCWSDDRTGQLDAYATRVTAGGVLPTPWPAVGDPISLAPGNVQPSLLAADGNGGAVVAWSDLRDGSFQAAFAQNVDHFAQLGDATPSIASIRDVTGDQGGRVRMVWNASYLDVDPQYAIGEYWIWRQSPASLAEAAVKGGARWLDAGLEAEARRMSAGEWNALARRGLFMRADVYAASYAWEFVASQPASGFGQYSYVAGTTRDSLGSGNPQTVFMVQARYTSGVAFWNSSPDSGYSVDNLAPVSPSPFTALYQAGATRLHWGANGEADLGGYRLYRGSSAGFVPGPDNLVVAQPDTGYDDVGPAGSYYKLSAVDVHGNESLFALVTPSGTVDVGFAALPRELALGSAAPNPARVGTALMYALPARARVSLTVCDAAGRRVRTLVDADLEAGERVQRWDGSDDAGRAMPNGLYFVRLSALGRTLVRRVVIAR